MVRIIVTATLIVLLAVLVSFNLKFTTSISVVGAQFHDVPVIVVALLSFALGVVYSLFLYIGQYLHRRSKRNLERLSQDIAQRRQELSTREPVAPRRDGEAPPPEGEDEQPAKAGSRFLRRFRRP